jgi:metal-dependent amidase/aminoacylase/carboxypeptidase family protein
MRLQTIVSSEVSPKKFATLICREFHASSLYIKPPENVTFILEIKYTEVAVREQVLRAIERIVHAECDAAQGKIEATISTKVRVPITDDDTHSAETLRHAFIHYFGERYYVPEMDLAMEDFPMLGPDIPYIYWRLGSTNGSKWDEAEKNGKLGDLIPYPHSPYFAPDPELTIQTGTDAMSLAALTFLSSPPGASSL